VSDTIPKIIISLNILLLVIGTSKAWWKVAVAWRLINPVKCMMAG
jgi:hypothetical protein